MKGSKFSLQLNFAEKRLYILLPQAHRIRSHQFTNRLPPLHFILYIIAAKGLTIHLLSEKKAPTKWIG